MEPSRPPGQVQPVTPAGRRWLLLPGTWHHARKEFFLSPVAPVLAPLDLYRQFPRNAMRTVGQMVRCFFRSCRACPLIP